MTSTRRTFLASAALLPLAAAGTALADSDGGGWWPHWGMGRGMMGGDGWGGGMMGYGPEAMMDRIDGRLAFLKTELKITEAQSQAWDEFAKVVRQTGETHNQLMRSVMKEIQDGSFFQKPLPERLQYQQTMMEARVENIKSVRAALDKLYAQLDDTQKKSADEIVLPMMGMGMGRGMGPGWMFRKD
jgi:hypothetical protein